MATPTLTDEADELIKQFPQNEIARAQFKRQEQSACSEGIRPKGGLAMQVNKGNEAQREAPNYKDDWRALRRVQNSFQAVSYGEEMADDDEFHTRSMVDRLRGEATSGNSSDLGWGVGSSVFIVGCLLAGLIQSGLDGGLVFLIIVVLAVVLGNYVTAKNRRGYGRVSEELVREWLLKRQKVRQLAQAGNYEQLVHEGHLQRMEQIQFEIYQKMREG